MIVSEIECKVVELLFPPLYLLWCWVGTVWKDMSSVFNHACVHGLCVVIHAHGCFFRTPTRKPPCHPPPHTQQQKTLTAKRGVPQATLLVDTTSSAVVSPPAVISQPHTSSVEVEHAAVHQGVAGVAVRRNSKVHPEGVQLHIGVGRSQQECRVGCVHSVVKDHTIHIGTCVQEVGTVNETVL